MASIVRLLIIAAAIAGVYGDSFNVTNSTQDYFLISQRELFHQIEIVDLEIAAVDARYSDRLDTIQYQQNKLLHEILQVNRTLMPMQALSLSRKYCIQKYDSQFVSYGSAKMKLDVCYNNGVLWGKALTKDAKSYVEIAHNTASNQLPKTVSSCDSEFSKNQTALELCYINAVETSNALVNSYLEMTRERLEKSLYDAVFYSRTVTDCSFLVEKSTLETIGATNKLMDDCYVSFRREVNGAASTNVDSKIIEVLKIGSVAES